MNSKKKAEIHYIVSKPAKTDIRLRMSRKHNIALNLLAQAMNTGEVEIAEQFLDLNFDEDRNVLISNFDTGFTISLSEGIQCITDDQFDEITEARIAHESKTKKRVVRPAVKAVGTEPDDKEEGEEKAPEAKEEEKEVQKPKEKTKTVSVAEAFADDLEDQADDSGESENEESENSVGFGDIDFTN